MIKNYISVAQMVEHIVALCSATNVFVLWCERTGQAYSLADCEEVCIPRIKSPISYAIALHEFGHQLGRYQKSKRVLVREVWAWNWARQNALIWNERMEQRARLSLKYYQMREQRLGPTWDLMP
jgi:hypothetical protein